MRRVFIVQSLREIFLACTRANSRLPVKKARTLRAGAQRRHFEGANLMENGLPCNIGNRLRQGIRSNGLSSLPRTLAKPNLFVADGGMRYLTAFGNTLSEMILPVLDPAIGEVVGTIDVESDRSNPFSPRDKDFRRLCKCDFGPVDGKSQNKRTRPRSDSVVN
jgi:hypothetical protein